MRATSKEYAAALFALAQESGTEESMLEELRLLGAAFEGAPEYAAFLSAPSVSLRERLDAVESAFGADFSEYAVSFVSLLCEQGGAALLPDCAKEYERLYDEANRVSHACVTSAVALTQRQKQALCRKLEQLSGGRVRLRYAIDPSLLGGLTVDLDGLFIDGSLRGRLKNIREVMGE